MSLIFKTNHVDEAIANLLQQFKNKTNWPKVLTAFIEQVQELEDMFGDLIAITDLDAAEGVQADVLGSIIGEAREGRNDEDYLIGIRGRILVNKSEGTPVDIIDLMTTITGTTVQLRELFPAAYEVFIDSPVASEDEAARFAVLMRAATGAGINAQLRYAGDVPSTQFRFATPGQGFDEGEYTGVV